MAEGKKGRGDEMRSYGRKAPKVIIAHYDDEAVEWVEISASGNAAKAHVGKHGDGAQTDFLIDTPEARARFDALAPAEGDEEPVVEGDTEAPSA
jgi:hypothetical protein